MLKANDLVAIDAELTPLRYKAEAASDGMLFWNPPKFRAKTRSVRFGLLVHGNAVGW